MVFLKEDISSIPERMTLSRWSRRRLSLAICCLASESALRVSSSFALFSTSSAVRCLSSSCVLSSSVFVSVSLV